MEVSKSGFYEHLGRKKPNARIERVAPEGFAVEAFGRRRGRELRKSGIGLATLSWTVS